MHDWDVCGGVGGWIHTFQFSEPAASTFTAGLPPLWWGWNCQSRPVVNARLYTCLEALLLLACLALYDSCSDCSAEGCCISEHMSKPSAVWSILLCCLMNCSLFYGRHVNFSPWHKVQCRAACKQPVFIHYNTSEAVNLCLKKKTGSERCTCRRGSLVINAVAVGAPQEEER